jgi:hypothetical protein
MWVLVGASPTDPTSNGQSDVEDVEAGSIGRSIVPPLSLNKKMGLPLLHLARHFYIWPATATFVERVEFPYIPISPLGWISRRNPAGNRWCMACHVKT